MHRPRGVLNWCGSSGPSLGPSSGVRLSRSNKFTPKQRFMAMSEMLAAARLPAPIKVIGRLLGRRRYQRFMAKVRG